ncbi:hypothetical protein [Streptomyces peucetius]|uniref:Secreted protein n=1 Tax=Streptomyces peucetius TaxID=1950 RepID=A0ABY6IAB3_STRPE|nr:hypothetical protein [Streptomyces peucetius]UYQ63135.1 hypothetical protein OGH68_17735 [Streptomyces peucetius]
MRRRTGPGIVASALCLCGALTACGGGSSDGDVALGAAGAGSDGAPTAAVPPKGKVSLAPLDGVRDGPAAPAAKAPGKTPGKSSDASGRTTGQQGDSGQHRAGTGDRSGTNGSGQPEDGGPQLAPGPDGTPGTPAPSPSPKPPPTPPAPAPPDPEPGPTGPAVLRLGEPVREALDKRWCEKVTVEFRNSGGTAATSGTVTFATHIIGALGIDWATVESRQPLPAPIAPGAVRKRTYTVCVEAWRVPWGMHMETQDVTATWK